MGLGQGALAKALPLDAGCGPDLAMPHAPPQSDPSAFPLQESERNLCAHLNTLAIRLMAKAEDAGAGGRVRGAATAAARAGEEGEAEEDDEALASQGPTAKRPRRSKGGTDAPSGAELRARALLLLEQSFRVAEKGIAGTPQRLVGSVGAVGVAVRRMAAEPSKHALLPPLPFPSPGRAHGGAEGHARHCRRLHRHCVRVEAAADQHRQPAVQAARRGGAAGGGVQHGRGCAGGCVGKCVGVVLRDPCAVADRFDAPAWLPRGSPHHAPALPFAAAPVSQEKAAYLRAQAEMELTSAQQRLEQLQQQAEAARAAFTLHLGAATE